MDGKSLASDELKLKQLYEILPEVFTENKVDWEKLKAALGEDVNFSNERYVLNWAGKSDTFKVLQAPSTRTLIPVKDESVNFDETENIFIEGENLEVLKVLQKSYFGKVKMIYIDPPYNTGNDSFIYPDRFGESKEEYLKHVGDKDENGYMTKEGMFRKNSRENGQYHSNWLNMMYPRLFLAKNLLRQDGVIFVSIDDNEVHNLRLLMNEVFGEENFVASIIWQKKYAVSADDPKIASMHDYIICFHKSENFKRILLPRTEKQLSRYKNPDNDPRGVWSSDNYVSNKSKDERPTLWYPIKHPKTGEDVWPDPNAVWRYSKDKHEQTEKENRLYWGPDENYDKPRIKRFLSEIQDGLVPSTWWDFKDVGHNDEGQKETAELIGKKVFSTPKPVRLLNKILKISTQHEDIVLDFFAGSGTTSHAVMDLNKEDGGNRKYICVQLPELCDEKSEAFKAGYKTIADIAKERIRRVIKKIKDDREGKLDFGESKPDPGFKVFKLADSNFKQWRTDIGKDVEVLKQQLLEFIDPVASNATVENMVYELMLKSGKDLNSKLKHKNSYYCINKNELILMLEKADQDIADGVARENPQKVIALDRIFEGNDQLKTNTALQMKDAGIEFKTI
ncbi:MAG: site-specific DNA-methyltransferase [Desulfobacterales bacterium]|nr:site-specific DNA-methyltransferase [Desulfobacterales bacterium]